MPDDADVARIRFTPITAAYRPALRLSLAIARRRGLFSEAAPDGSATGVILDMAELWELFVVAALRDALPDVAVTHGTRDDAGRGGLLVNDHGDELGRMLPDALVADGEMPLVVDAKYKSLRSSQSKRFGVEREDMYQMAAYLSRWGGSRARGLLVYRYDDGESPYAVARGPWSLHDGAALTFVALPTRAEAAEDALREVFALTSRV